MGIQALPNSTVRVLGASQVLNDPAAVVKELIDNALDARSTSISVEISNNTLDSIQVRDNGHGIPPEDRQLVAQPHCTSKITSEDDLQDIGGMSLGFRGEALASVAEMSSSLTISTRVEGEQVAVALKINQQGEVIGQERASLPVGTTIKITDFLKALSVRKQVALKNIEKCLKKIKQTLQSYAFARPYVRISLRVLKAKSDKGNWTYAPKAGGNAEDAAFKVVGAACASQCTWSVIEDQGFTLQAFLPRSDADVSKVSNIGSFLSVDARPVSAARGTPKQIAKIFREAMKKAGSGFNSVKEPFIYLDIACPTGSYDANVEPAKDDVLFANPDIVVDAVRKLFDAVYPVQERQEPDTDTTDPGPSRAQHVDESVDEDDFVTSLERPGRSSIHPTTDDEDAAFGSGMSVIQQDSVAGDDHDDRTSDAARRRSFRNNMYGCDEEDLDLMDARPPTGRTEADFEEMRQARKDVNLSNPWVMAKMNATVRRPMPAEYSEEQVHADKNVASLYQPSSQQYDLPLIDLEVTGLPTPRPSSPSPPSQDFHPSDHVPQTRLARDGRLIGSQALPPPEMLMPPPSSMHDAADEEVIQCQDRRPAGYDYTLSSQLSAQAAGTPLHAIPYAGRGSRRGPQKRLQQAQINKPFVSPLPDQAPREKVWFDHLEDEGQARVRLCKKRQYHARTNNGMVDQGELGDLIEDPRQLTPPRRNRDMRDFVTPADMSGDDSITSMIESRNYPVQKPAKSVTDAGREDGENNGPEGSILNRPGFMRASELQASEDEFGRQQKTTSRPTKRRKTSESRALREASGNAGIADDNEDYQLRPQSRATSRRRRTTDGNSSKARRTKSAKLPLERVPAGQAIHNVLFTLDTSMRQISRFAGKIDEEMSLLAWKQPTMDAYDGFAKISDPREVEELAMKLRWLLVNHSPEDEMVQDLGGLVRNAFAARTETDADGSVAGNV